MTNLSAYDDSAKEIEKFCEKHDLTECELIDMLIDYLDEVEYTLQKGNC